VLTWGCAWVEHEKILTFLSSMSFFPPKSLMLVDPLRSAYIRVSVGTAPGIDGARRPSSSSYELYI
jgi:hypothetical protein